MAKKKVYEEFTDENTEYELIVTVPDYPSDNDKDQGTLIELAERWPIVKTLIADDSMLYEPIYMDLTIGLAHWKLYPLEE